MIFCGKADINDQREIYNALLKEVKHEKPLIVSQDKCKSCKMCMKIGCPAISMKGGKAKIDETLCVGCGVCTQMCKFDAINKA